MKTARFLFTIIAFGALTLGVGYAGEPSSQPSEQVLHENHATGDPSAKPAQGSQARGKIEQTDGKDWKPKDDSHHSDLKENAYRSNATQNGHLANAKEDGRDAKPKEDGHHPRPKEEAESKRAASAAKDRLMKHKAERDREQPAKSPVGSEPVAARPGVVRIQNAAKAGIGAVRMTARAKNSAGALDGTAVKLKHKTY